MENHFGERIKQLRLYKKITQEDFAKIVGVSKWTVINWESNKRIPNAEKLFLIAKALDIAPAYLMETEEQRRNRIEQFNYINYGTEQHPETDLITETAVSAALHYQDQPDELISLLAQIRKLMIYEYPTMDVNDKNAVKSILAKINTLVDDTTERNE